MKKLEVTEFFNTSFIEFAGYDCYRNITSVVDGFKLSQRKVMFTVDKLNITSDVKVEQLAPKTAELTEYLHGSQSLFGVITGIAAPWGIWNNLPLLAAEGNFGKRLNTTPSAPRYIYTYKKEIFDFIFRKEDKIILNQLNFEGNDIEYNHYLPIVPYAFFKICDGVGTGFSHLIMPRNPKEVIENVLLMLDGKSPNSLLPYSEGFNGTIERGATPNSYVYKGTIERISPTKINVIELPISYDLAKYTSVLNELEDKNIIAGFKDISDTKQDKFLFEVKVSKEFSSMSDDKILETLKLVERFTDNLTMLGEDNKIIQFNNDVEIFEYWFKYRLKKYEERRNAYSNLLS